MSVHADDVDKRPLVDAQETDCCDVNDPQAEEPRGGGPWVLHDQAHDYRWCRQYFGDFEATC